MMALLGFALVRPARASAATTGETSALATDDLGEAIGKVTD